MDANCAEWARYSIDCVCVFMRVFVCREIKWDKVNVVTKIFSAVFFKRKERSELNTVSLLESCGEQ